MNKPISINNVDFAPFSYGYKVHYEPVYGNNGGYMLNATYTEDELDQKAVVEVPLRPLNEEDMAEALSTVLGSPYASVYFYDPEIKALRTMTARRTVSQIHYRGIGADGNEYWSSLVVTLRER